MTKKVSTGQAIMVYEKANPNIKFDGTTICE